MNNQDKNILSLFDFSGIWSSFYKNNGYRVIQIDIKLNQKPNDIFDIDEKYLDSIKPVYGILAAPPCTDTAVAGAKHFAAKDADGRTQKSIEIFNKTLEIIKYCKPKFWCLEQPVSRLMTLVPEFKQYYRGTFQPYEFGDPYRKRTVLFGDFNFPKPINMVAPLGVRKGQPDQWFSRVGGKSEKTKEYRSKTSEKFAYQFYLNNK